ncbi:cadherin repeat domain-containing protein [Chryseolinea lacunae]|uniref:Cadherin repeat domain-containing protein n=1 Tax=Chryseolinea lacunae TaxID=2801331 RepID=A0ABS1KZ35_9BACT|nr:cadherin repeat domain-containing protein [Chryseolinea lacunae]MBL0744716.1 cadherin repeat domain-containing protein [Chryseolinea lacunae]
MSTFSWRSFAFLCIFGFVVVAMGCRDDDPAPAPVVDVADFEVAIDELPESGTVLGTLDATTDKGTLAFQLLSESVIGSFAVNATTGSLTVLDGTKFDFSKNTAITAVVVVKNDNVESKINVKVNIQKIALDVTPFEITIDENPKAETALGTLKATTSKGTLSYTLQSESVTGAFAVNSTTGVLSVLNSSLFDFEKNETLTAVITVSNGKKQAALNVKVNLQKIIWTGEDLVFTKASGADWTQAENYDKISDKVIFTRQTSGPIYNYQWWLDTFDGDATFDDLNDDFWDGTSSTREFTRQGGTNGVRWAILDDTGSSTDAWSEFNLYGTLGDPAHFYSFHNIASMITQLEQNSAVTGAVDNFSVTDGVNESSGTDMPGLVGKKLGVWLVEEDIYFTLTFNTWGSGKSNNTISYTRSTKD